MINGTCFGLFKAYFCMFIALLRFFGAFFWVASLDFFAPLVRHETQKKEQNHSTKCSTLGQIHVASAK